MTNLWFCQTPNPPRTPVFYMLTTIHKPTLVGRPIITTPSTDSKTTGVISLRLDEKMRVPENTIFVSMDITSIHTNIPQEEGTNETECKAYKSYYEEESPIPTQYLKRAHDLGLGFRVRVNPKP